MTSAKLLVFLSALVFTLSAPAPGFCEPSDQSICWPTPDRSKRFATSLHGSVILPTDSQFYNATLQNNVLYHKIPAIIVQPYCVEDVVATVRFAKQHRMHISVSSGRHAYDGQGLADDTIHIDMQFMNQIEVNTSSMTVWAQMGADFHKLYTAVDKVGKIFVGGSCPTVRLGGFTQAGGTSVLSRMKGLTADNVLTLRMVTADGDLVEASSKTNPELMFALLGGGGNFGIIVDATYKLHEPPSSWTGLSLGFFYETPNVTDCGGKVLAWYKEFMQQLPNKWSIYVIVDGGPAYSLHPGKVAGHDILNYDTARMLLARRQRTFGGRVFKSGTLHFNGLFWGSFSDAQESIQPLLAQHPECQLRTHLENDLKAYKQETGNNVSLEPLQTHNTFLDYQFAGHEDGCSVSGGLGCSDRMTSVPLLPTIDMYDSSFISLMRRVAAAKELERAGKTSGITFMWTALGGAASNPNPQISVNAGLRSTFGNAAINVYWSDHQYDAGNISLSRELALTLWNGARRHTATPTAYIGYPSTDGMQDWKVAYYGSLENYARLLSVKKQWDPRGVFQKFQGVGYSDRSSAFLRPQTRALADEAAENTIMV